MAILNVVRKPGIAMTINNQRDMIVARVYAEGPMFGGYANAFAAAPEMLSDLLNIVLTPEVAAAVERANPALLGHIRETIHAADPTRCGACSNRHKHGGNCRDEAETEEVRKAEIEEKINRWKNFDLK